MRRASGALLPLLFTALAASSCGDEGTLERVRFDAEARSVLATSAPASLRTPSGWDVTLRAAYLSVGAVYCRTAPPSSGTSSIEEGRVVAQVLSGFTVDALRAEGQPIEGGGNAVTERARGCELRLRDATEGPIYEAAAGSSATALARVSGTARRGTDVIEFDGVLDAPIDRSRPAVQSVADRRIYGIAVDFVPSADGVFTVRVDPTHWLDDVQFDALPMNANGSGTRGFDSVHAREQLRANIATAASVRVEFRRSSMN